MTWTTPIAGVTGDVMTTGRWNTDVVNNLAALRGIGIGSKTGFVSLTPAAVTFGSVVLDDLAVISTTNAYQTVPWAGRFVVSMNAIWSGASGTGNGAGIRVERQNSSGVVQEILGQVDIGAGQINLGMNCPGGIADFAAGDRVVFFGYNGASGAAGTLAIRGSVEAHG